MVRQDNMCSGKEKYKTKELANLSAAHLNNMGGRRLVSYKCSVCDFCHVGHENKRKKMPRNDKTKNKQIDYVHEPGLHIVDVDKLK
jgi:hypothetical protein